MKTYVIETMGCQMNDRDSETIAGLLEQMGYTQAVVENDEAALGKEERVFDSDGPPLEYNGPAAIRGADIFIVNTCSVRENADNRFFGMLGHLKHVKLKSPNTIIAVCGCMMQQEHIVEQIKDKHAWVDLVFGTHNIADLPELINGVLHEREAKAEADGEETKSVPSGKRKTHEPATFVLPERIGLAEGLPAKRRFSFKGSVNIMYGCNNFCTYCVVPYTRGREISRDPGDILTEVKELAGFGVKEILLLGQNVNSYAGGKTDFADLIDMVDVTPGVERIRFMTSHPKDLSDKLIDRFRPYAEGGARSLCPSIHLPLQAGSTRVLERMNRRYTKEGYLALVEKLRSARPDIVISTDFIVGFPGETEEDFEDTMDVIEKARFDAAFTFLFSPRKGTPAAEYEDPEPEASKRERFGRMVKRLNEITLEKNRTYIESVQYVLVEGTSKTDAAMLSGRTFGGKLVNFKAPAGVELIGTIVPVRIMNVKTFSFSGELIR